jgi:RNA polymerase sigma-70 factor (ECF subfamily)
METPPASVQAQDFERLVLPHKDAAYNLALWLMGNRADADDVAQDALVRAWRGLDGLRGGSVRAWLLSIVRNTAYSHLQRRSKGLKVVSIDEGGRWRDNRGRAVEPVDDAPSVESTLVAADDKAELAAALAELPLQLREAIVLREMEGLSYREIAGVMETPVGTVMSRLSRAREQLRQTLETKAKERHRAV